MVETVARALSAASRALMLAGAAGLVVMTLIIGWQVFGRYVLNDSPSWSEQASLVLMIWYVSFAAAAGVRLGFHIRISALADGLPGPWPARLKIASLMVIALVGVAMAAWGGELIARTWSHSIPTLGLPRGFAYLPLPISGALMTLFAAEQIFEIATGAARATASGDD